MSNFNINDISYICEHINNQDQFALDPESEYYNQELAEAIEDILTTISVNMISNGHTAEGVINFLENSSEQDILEYYLNPPVISEDSVSEEFVLQELARLEEGLGAVVSGLKLLGKGAMKAAAPIARTAKVAAKRIAGPGVRKAIGGAVSKVKDIAGKVAPKLPGIAKGALLAGTGVGVGYLGAKLAGRAGTQGKQAPSTGPQTVAAAGGKGGKVTVGREYDAVLGGKKGKVTYSQSGEKFFKQTEKNAPKPPAAATPAAKPPAAKPPAAKPPAAKPPAAKPAGKSKMSQDAAELRDMQKASQMRQQGQDVTSANITSVRKDIEKFNKPEELNKPAPAGTALAAEQERRRKAKTETQKESYDAYDLVLEYLFATAQVETIAEAHYVMLEMDAEFIQDIVEKYSTFGYNADDPGDDFEQFVDKGPKTNKQKRNGIQLNNKILSKPGMPIKGV